MALHLARADNHAAWRHDGKGARRALLIWLYHGLLGLCLVCGAGEWQIPRGGVYRGDVAGLGGRGWGAHCDAVAGLAKLGLGVLLPVSPLWRVGASREKASDYSPTVDWPALHLNERVWMAPVDTHVSPNLHMPVSDGGVWAARRVARMTPVLDFEDHLVVVEEQGVVRVAHRAEIHIVDCPLHVLRLRRAHTDALEMPTTSLHTRTEKHRYLKNPIDN